MPLPQVCDSISLSVSLPVQEKHIFRMRYVVQVLADTFGVFLYMEHAILLQNLHRPVNAVRTAHTAMQLDDRAHPLIDTPKVTELQMLICVGAGDVCMCNNLIFYVMLRLVSVRLLHVGPDGALRR